MLHVYFIVVLYFFRLTLIKYLALRHPKFVAIVSFFDFCGPILLIGPYFFHLPK